MIRFACPRCKAILERSDSEAGTTFSCPSCGQRMQVPQAVAPRMTLPETAAGSSVPLPSNNPHSAVPLPPTYVTANPDEVKTPASTAASGWEAADADGERARGRDRERPRQQDREFDAPRPRPTRRRFGRDDDEEDDFGDFERRPRTSRYSREVAIKAASSGFVCAMIGLGLLVVAFIVFVVATRRTPGGRQMDPLFFVIVLLTVGSFILGLMGTIFSARGLDDSNNYNRGFAVGGLVCGIIDLVLSSIGGIILLCVGMFIWSFRM